MESVVRESRSTDVSMNKDAKEDGAAATTGSGKNQNQETPVSTTSGTTTVSITKAIKIARENNKAAMQQIRYLQKEYLSEVVYDALKMLGYAGDAKSADKLAYWVLEINSGRPADLVKRFMATNERTGHPQIRRKITHDYNPDRDPANGLRLSEGMAALMSLVNEPSAKMGPP